jgi:hypothetical protein
MPDRTPSGWKIDLFNNAVLRVDGGDSTGVRRWKSLWLYEEVSLLTLV